MSHTRQFVEVYGALRGQAGWFGPDALALTSQSVTLVLADRADLVPELPAASKRLGKALGWFSNLAGSLGHSIAALALVKNIDPAAIPDRVEAVKQQFKVHGVPRVGLWPTAAASWLALEPSDAVGRAVPRMAAILAEWTKDHPWITGHDDLHAAALHALGPRSPQELRPLVEDRMVALESAGFQWAPNNRQRAAQLAALQPGVSADELGRRFSSLEAALRTQGYRPSMVEHEALVLLAVASGDTGALAADYREARDLLGAMKGSTWLGAPIRGVVAAGMVAADRGGEHVEAISGSTLAAIVAAIQAAAIAATVGATAAAT